MARLMKNRYLLLSEKPVCEGGSSAERSSDADMLSRTMRFHSDSHAKPPTISILGPRWSASEPEMTWASFMSARGGRGAPVALTTLRPFVSRNEPSSQGFCELLVPRSAVRLR
jgi:hypothetical protein